MLQPQIDDLELEGAATLTVQLNPEVGPEQRVRLLRYPIEVGLVGDTQATLQKLLPLLVRNEDRRFLEKAQESMDQIKGKVGGSTGSTGNTYGSTSPNGATPGYTGW